MVGKSPITADGEQRAALRALAHPRPMRGGSGAAMLLTLMGWTSPRIAEVRRTQDTVRLWRGDFADGGVEALKASVAPGPAPVKSEAALRVVTPLLEAPVANRRNWTIPRLISEIRRARASGSAGRNYPRRCEKKLPVAAAAAHLERSPDRRRDRARGLRLQLRKAQAEAGDIVLLYGDESEALTHLIWRGRGPSAAPICACRRRDKPKKWR